MFNSKEPNFSTLFLNACAHIQHHYLFNSKAISSFVELKNPDWYLDKDDDPLEDVLELYNLIIGELFSCVDSEVVVATGLSQVPYDRIKFYYRLKNHSAFLTSLGIKFLSVLPRMTRDFLIEFKDETLAADAEIILKNILVINSTEPLFGLIDNRGSSLFVTLTYSCEITELTYINVNNIKLFLLPQVSFVAIKNGMHSGEGFAFFSNGVSSFIPTNALHVAELGNIILNFFHSQLLPDEIIKN